MRIAILAGLVGHLLQHGSHLGILRVVDDDLLTDDVALGADAPQTAEEVYKDRKLGPEDIRHILSMVFPMARLKNYIEIRCADSMPIEGSLRFTALIKGLYIRPEKLYNLMDEFDLSSAQDTITAEDEVMEHGLDAVVYGMRAGDILDRMLAIAAENLDEEERKYLYADC